MCGVPNIPTKIVARACGRILDPTWTLSQHELSSERRLIEEVPPTTGAVVLIAQEKHRFAPGLTDNFQRTVDKFLGEIMGWIGRDVFYLGRWLRCQEINPGLAVSVIEKVARNH